MIVTTDIANILYRDFKVLGIDIVPFGETLTGELDKERITIHVKKPTSEDYWVKRFAEVNICVPDIRPNMANTIRLNELERLVNNKFQVVTDTQDGTRYKYEVETSIEADTALKCHFVNCKVLFNVLNVR